MQMSWNRLALAVAILATLAALCAPEVRAGGYRLTATIDEPFEVSGTLYPPGTVSVRQLDDYTPTSTFNELWVGDDCLGMILATTAPYPGDATVDSLFFERAPMGHLVLTGFAYRGQRAQDLSRIRSGSSEPSIMVASR